MVLLFLLKGPHFDLAASEAKAAVFGWGWWKDKTAHAEGTILLDSRRAPQHLSLSRFATKVIMDCAPGDLKRRLAAARIPVKGSFKIVLTDQIGTGTAERELATIIWSRLPQPKVDLQRPDTVIDIVITAKRAYVGVRIWTNAEDFESRRTHLLPAMHPSGMHPSIARALVNLSCAKSIHDPFCGAGGLLIEAGLSHRKASGADIDPAMVVRARKNAAGLRLHPELRVADAMMWVPRCQAIIADLPYGRNTRPAALIPLLEASLHRASLSTKRAIIGLPAQLPMPGGWTVRAHFEIYVHKSMTRHFYVLEKH